jgi:hypothetical protein
MQVNVMCEPRKASSKDLTKDHVIIVGRPGSSLEKDLSYQTEKDLSKNGSHTNVGFVGLLGWCDRKLMRRWLRSVNMRLEFALWTADMSYIRQMDHPWIGVITLDMDYTFILEVKGSLCNSLLTGLGVSQVLVRFLWSLCKIEAFLG